MPQYGVYANRNAGHKARQAELWAAASTDAERLTAAFDSFRSAVRLLARRRPPRDARRYAHQDTAARLVRDMTAHLKNLADAIDRNEYDETR